MALRLASYTGASSFTPATSLDDVLKEFDRTLSEDERRRYRGNCSKPSAQSVLDFVSEIDANNRGRGGRCTATRLVTFLDVTQRFVSTVDTFVSSNPKLAALLWGGVKTTILIASNIASYFDAVTNLIMDIGRSCPAYQEFGNLFPDSIGLQVSLFEYFTIFVKLCIQIIQERHKSSTTLIYRAFVPLDATFKPYKKDLDRVAKDVQLQIALAAQQAAQSERQLSDNERKLNSHFRRSISKVHADTYELQLQSNIRETMRLRATIKDMLSPVNHIKPWKRNRQQCVDNTTTWIECDPNFLAWMSGGGSSILWCSGNLGTGKTVLISSVIAHLHTLRNNFDKLAYFFCQAEESISLTARNIIGGIFSQLLESHIEEANVDQLNKLYREIRSFDTEDLTSLILRLQPSGLNYICIDGLDECEETEVRKVATVIDTLIKDRGMAFKIFCASRPELEAQLFPNARPDHKIKLSGEKIDSDIKRYIEMTLSEKVVLNQMAPCDPTLIRRIEDVLLQGAQGMFLWTRLLIEDICSQETDDDVIATLENPPIGLKELFRRMRTRVTSKRGAARAVKVLQLCGVAKRPFAVDELREALTIERGQKDLDSGKLVYNFSRVLADCGSFVFIDEEEQTVHYIHHSAKTYLFTEDPDSNVSAFEEAALDKELGILCMTYLGFDVFRGQMTRAKNAKSPEHVPIDALDIAKTALSTSRGANTKLSAKIAQRLLHSKNDSRPAKSQDVRTFLQNILEISEASRPYSEFQSFSFHFMSYAQPHWIFHLKNLDDSHKKTWDLFCECVQSLGMATQLWENHQPDTYDLLTECLSDLPRDTSDIFFSKVKRSEFLWIFRHQHAALLLHFFTLIGAGHAEEIGRRLLRHFSGRGQMDLIDTLLSAPRRYMQGFGQAILASAKVGHLDIIDRLITAKAELNAPIADWEFGDSVLTSALEGHFETVDRLIAAMTDVNVTISSEQWEYVLRRRSVAGKMVMLRTHGFCDGIFQPTLLLSLLQVAVGCGQVKLAEKILAANGRVNIKDPTGQTVLHYAASMGCTEIMEMLLMAADEDCINVAGSNCWTALHYAAKFGHTNTVGQLLAAGADVNASQDCYYGGNFCLCGRQTPLHLAAEAGWPDVVDRLLSAYADVWRTDLHDQTSYDVAFKFGHCDIAERIRLAQRQIFVRIPGRAWFHLGDSSDSSDD